MNGDTAVERAPDEVHAGRERVDRVLLHARIVDANLRVGDTAAVPRLRVRLVLDNAVALGRTTRHCDGLLRSRVRVAKRETAMR